METVEQNPIITEPQLKEIALAGFPDLVLKSVNLDDHTYMVHDGVYRLYHKDTPFMLKYPKTKLLAVVYRRDHVSFHAGSTSFNQLAAIQKMEELGLI